MNGGTEFFLMVKQLLMTARDDIKGNNPKTPQGMKNVENTTDDAAIFYQSLVQKSFES